MQMLRSGKSFSGHEANCIFLNTGQGPFADVSGPSGLDFFDDGRAVCLTDWDQDGDLDVWFHNRTGPRLRFMQNQVQGMPGWEPRHFLSLHLRGTTSNRDAIGSRVTVWQTLDDQPLTRTLRAGDAFLSQSSKSLHFGLGDNDAIDRVEVRWPDGKSTTIRNVKADQRYLIIEGESEAERFPMLSRKTNIHAGDQPAVKQEPAIRTVLSNRIPLPVMRYRSLDGEERTVAAEENPQLVILWASWCPTCRAELTTLTSHAEELSSVQVKPLLIALDGLDLENKSDADDVQRFVEELGLPFDVGVADRSLLEKLQLTESVLFNRPPPVAVPLSLLLDQYGAIAVIYRGAIDFDQLAVDAQSLGKKTIDRRDQAVPFAGRWLNSPKQMLLRAVGHLFEEHGFEEDYARYLKLDTEVLSRQRELAGSPEQRRKLDQAYAAANYNLGVALVAQGQDSRAFEFFQQAVSANPNHCDATVNLAVLYAKQRNIRKSIELLRHAIEIDPESLPARANLANAMSAAGAFQQAIPHYQHLVDIKRANASVYSRLGRAFIETGQITQAAQQLQNAVERGATDLATLSSLAWLRATATDDSVRDAQEAILLAERLGNAPGIPPVMLLDLQSVIQAEAGNFEAAIDLATEATSGLGDQQPKLRTLIKKRIEGYRKSLPHRDKDGKYP